MTSSAKIKVFILGSCVTRDAFEKDEAAFEIVAYYARTSLGSIFAKPTELVQDGALASKFQQSMLESDFDKSVLADIKTRRWDVLILDMIDDRFDLLKKGEEVVSESSCFSAAGLLPGMTSRGFQRLPVGSPEREAAWMHGWKQLQRLLSESFPERPVAINCARWALRSDAENVSLLPNRYAMRQNVVLRSMYRVISRTKSSAVKMIEYDDGLIVCDPTHKWGVAAFHYTAPFYKHLRENLVSIAHGV